MTFPHKIPQSFPSQLFSSLSLDTSTLPQLTNSMSSHGSDDEMKKEVGLHTKTMDAPAEVAHLPPSAMTTRAKTLALAIAIGGFLFGE